MNHALSIGGLIGTFSQEKESLSPNSGLAIGEPVVVDSVDPDAALMLRVGMGDECALAQVIDRWKNPLLNFFYRSTGSYETSEDLAQVVFVKLHRASSKYQPSAKFSTFLFHIARRLLINEYRRNQRKPLDAVDPADLQAVDSGRSERAVAEIEEAFSLALRRLPEKQATAILLFKQQGLSYEEIADSMDASVGAVKTWIFRARETLKTELKETLTTVRQL